MQITFLTFILILFTACGKKEVKKLDIESKYQPHVEEFKLNASRADHPIKIDNLVIKSVSNLNGLNKTGNTLGVCYSSYRETTDMWGNKKIYATPIIHIDLEDWPTLGSAGQKQLIFHELGHCVLRRPHSNSTNSIMYPYHNVIQNSFVSRYNAMVYELYNPSKTVAAIGFQAINLASTMDVPDIDQKIDERTNSSLDEFASTNMNEDEVGHIEHDDDCHKIIRIVEESKAE